MNLQSSLYLVLEFLCATLGVAMYCAIPIKPEAQTGFWLFLRVILLRVLAAVAGGTLAAGAIHFGILASRTLGGWPYAIAGILGIAAGAAWNCRRAKAR